MSAIPKSVLQLIEKFNDNAEHYRSAAYNEETCRVDFINPMFEVLGWDMANRAGYADAYRDVIHEEALRVGGSVKAPDYCFRIGGTRKFFLEAKKPGVDIKKAPEPAFQVGHDAHSATTRPNVAWQIHRPLLASSLARDILKAAIGLPSGVSHESI